MNDHNHHGFTILELLLALALTSLLTAGLSMMIGQAARDRQSLNRPETEPAWMQTVIDCLQSDLQSARFWASVDDRLVLIGMGDGGVPSRVEYQWTEQAEQSRLVRRQSSLVGNGIEPANGEERVLAVNIIGLNAGQHTFGKPLAEDTDGSVKRLTTTQTPASQPEPSGISIVVGGTQAPLATIPGMLDLQLRATDMNGDSLTVSRKVVLR